MDSFVAPKNTHYAFVIRSGEEVNQLTSRQSPSAVKRVFFAPVDQQKFNVMRDRQERQVLRVDLFNIR